MSINIIRVQGSQGGLRQQQQPGHGLLMTATLNPPTAAVARSAPSERLNDYMGALRHYLDLPNNIINRILFIDNSNSDLTPLINMVQQIAHQKVVEFIGFSGNDHSCELGKAYGEFKLMDFGLAHTSLFNPDDLIWKTTGRLKILNFSEISESCEKLTFDVLCDLHNLPWVGSGNWRHSCHMDLRVFAFKRAAYDAVFRGLWAVPHVTLDAEFMYRQMRQLHQGLKVIPRFPVQLQLQGISGRHQRDYASSSQRTKDMVRRAVRRITPWLWL